MELFEKLRTLFASLAFFGLFREVLQLLLNLEYTNIQYRKRRNYPENSLRSPQFAGGLQLVVPSVQRIGNSYFSSIPHRQYNYFCRGLN